MAAYATVVAALDAVDQPSAATRARVSVVQDGDTMTVQVEVTGGDGTIVPPDCTDAADRVGAPSAGSTSPIRQRMERRWRQR